MRLKIWLLSLFTALSLSLLISCGGSSKSEAPALKIAYSDWPGWVAWDIAIEKGWFKEAGVNVDFQWFEYVASMDAFAAGQVDAVAVASPDALYTGATGAKNIAILLNDYSDGNDMVVAGPGIENMADLEGKKVGVEIGFVSHLLLLKGLESVGLTESDVELVNTPTHQTPQTLASGDVDAIVAWQPNSGQALKAVPGSKSVYSSADAKGLIYDLLVVTPESLNERKEDWTKVIEVWYRVVDFLKDEANTEEALEIMSARVNLSPEEYAPIVKGTYFLTAEESKKVLEKSAGFDSLYGSLKISDDFLVDYEVYSESQDIDSYVDPSIVMGL